MSRRWLDADGFGLRGLSRVAVAGAILLAAAALGCYSRENPSLKLSAAARQHLEEYDYPKALVEIRQARSLGSSDPETGDRMRLLEAEILIFDQQASQGLALLAGSLSKQSSTLAARHAMLTGAALRRLSQRTEAQKKLEWALTAARQAGDQRTETMANIQLSACLIAEGRLVEGAEKLNLAASLAASLNDFYLVGVVRFNQAILLMQHRESDRAIELYSAIAADASRRNIPVVMAKAVNNMAIAYQQVGDFERALEYNQRAVEVFERLDLPSDKVQAYGSRGRLLQALDRQAEAAVEIERALSLARKIGDVDLIRRWAGNQIPVLLALNRVGEAERLADELMKLGPDLAYSLASHGLVAERRGRIAVARAVWEKTLRTPGCPYPAKRDATFGLARLHVAANQREGALRRYREAVKLVDEAWAKLRTDDSRLTFLTGAMDLYHGFVRTSIQWGDENQALHLEESTRAKLLADRGGHGVETTARAESLVSLARRTKRVFLAYWLAPDGGSHVRVFTSSGANRVPLPGAEPREITRLVREHNELIEIQSADPRVQGTAAARLYNLLVKPVEAQVPPGSQVALIPDGALHRLNFETLVRVKNGRKGFWIEDIVLQVAPSLSLLNTRPAVSTRAPRLLLIGDALAAPEFDRLDHAAAEMKMIGDLFGAGAVTELSAEAATPSAYAASSPGAYSHIHFTAHAKADRESPLDSAVILTPETAAGGGEKSYRLLAREVAAIKLEADLVTVSACRSAGDRAVSGEGMVGFAWAFQKAGAANVVAGLWDVNDRSTASLMAELYKAIRAGKPVTEALRAAKLSFIAGGRNYSKPYYWAPFQVYSRSLPNGKR